MAANQPLPEQLTRTQQKQSRALAAALITPERSQKLDLLIHLIADLTQSLVVCGAKGIGKTTLLTLFQQATADAWPSVFLTATKPLSFEKIQKQLLLELTGATSGNVDQTLTALLAKIAKQGQAVVLLCDDAGLMSPGLITTLMRYAATFPCLKLVLALTADELAIKSRTDTVIDDCYLIEIPALSKAQCGEYLQQLSNQANASISFENMGANVPPGFDKENIISDAVKEHFYTKSKGIPGRMTEALPELLHTSDIKGFNGRYALVAIISLLALSIGFWLFKDRAPEPDTLALASAPIPAERAVASLAIPGQTTPEPPPPVAEADTAKYVNKPPLPEITTQPDTYKGHGRSLDGDALAEFEPNNQAATTEVDARQLKVEIIPPEPAAPEESLDPPSPPVAETAAEAHTAEATASTIKPPSSAKPEAIGTPVKKRRDTPSVAEPIKPSRHSEPAIAALKKPSEPLTRSALEQEIQREVLKKSQQHAIAVDDDLKSLSVVPKVNIAAPKAVVAKADALAPKTKPVPAKPEAPEKPSVVAAIKPPPAELQKNPLATAAKTIPAELLKAKPASPVDPNMAAKDSVAPDVAAKSKAALAKVPKNTEPALAEKSANSRYTLQLVSFTQQALVENFMRKYSAMGSNLRTIKISKDGNEKYLVVYGSFDSTVQANAAKQKLPPELSQAWARKM